MKGLLLKDWYAIKSYFRSFFIVEIAFIIMSCFNEGDVLFLFYPCILSGMIATTLISYEEREKWNVYAATLPYSKEQLVSSKYIVSLSFGLITVLVVSLVQGSLMVYRAAFNLALLSDLFIMLFLMALLPSAIMLPFIYKLGAEKGRIIYFVIIGAFAGIAVILMGAQDVTTAFMHNPYMDILIFVSVILVFGGSWLLSIRFYKKREL